LDIHRLCATRYILVSFGGSGALARLSKNYSLVVDIDQYLKSLEDAPEPSSLAIRITG